jgi:hypothetical protein
MLGCVFRVLGSMDMVAVSEMGVMRGGFMVAIGVMTGSLAVVARSVLVMIRCLVMMMRCFL